MESKYKERARELVKKIVPTGALESPNYVRGILEAMCQLAEEIEDYYEILLKNSYTEEQVEELLTKQRELSISIVEELINDNQGWDFDMFKSCIRNAKLKIE